MEFLLSLFQLSQKNLPLLALILTYFIVEFLTLCFVFSIKSISQGIKLFLTILISNIILVPLLVFLFFVLDFGLPHMGPHFRLITVSFYFVLIGIVTLIKSSIIALTMKKAFNRFIGWLFIINSVSVAILTIVVIFSIVARGLSLSQHIGNFLSVRVGEIPIAMMIKLPIITVGLRKIMSTRTVFVILLMSFASLFFSSFLQGTLPLPPLPDVVIYPLLGGVVGWILLVVIYPLLEGVVGWIFLKGRLSFRKFRELILLLVVASVVGKISVIIGVYALKVFFQV